MTHPDGTASGIRVEGLTVEHPTPAGPVLALAGVDLTIAPGSLTAVMGPSGCGKSTLLGVLAGLARPSAGTVHIGSTEISALAEPVRTTFRTATIGVVYQADNLLPFLTVRENVRLQLALSPGADDPDARTTDVLERLGLDALAERLPAELSGGQRQRVAVARAIVHKPGVLLADEPTGALDAVNAEAVMGLIHDAHRSLGATVVVVTHDADIAERMERVVRLRDGMLVADSEMVG